VDVRLELYLLRRTENRLKKCVQLQLPAEVVDMEEAIEGELHQGPLDADTALTQGHLHQLGVTQGTVELGMIIFLQCDLGQFHDLLLHVMRETIEGP